MSIFQGAFPAGVNEGASGQGKRPVIFDIVGPDSQTSLLPVGIRLVLFVNPTTMNVKHTRKVERIQTKGGFVEQHWGTDTIGVDFEMATGGFMRLYTGASSNTSPELTGGTRRESLSYDSFLDMLALFHNNGSVYDATGQVVIQGSIKVTFDGGVFLGWFNSFTVTEAADKPYQFTMSASMDISQELQSWRSVYPTSSDASVSEGSNPPAGISR